MPFGHFDPRYADDRWWGFFGWLIPLLLIALVVGLVVWLVVRTATRWPTPSLPAGWMASAPTGPSGPAGPPAADAAVQQARLRYAKGELSREAFLQVSNDLGSPGGDPGQEQEGSR